MKVWLEQPDITILSHGNLLLGFHQTNKTDAEEGAFDTQGVMYTLVYPSVAAVDEMYTALKDIADAPPRHNPTYRIYQFFATDPEHRQLEFQAFLHPIAPVSSDPSSQE